MALEIKQTMKLSQQLVMTPQLQQAIKLLQLSRLELQDLISTEMLENPLLEETEETKEEDDDVLKGEKMDDQRDVEQRSSSESEGSAVEDKAKDEFDWESYAESYTTTSTSQPVKPPEDLPTYEQTLTRKESLTDYLLWQLRMSDLSERQRRIAMNIIGNLNDDGYLTTTVEEIDVQEKVPAEDVELTLIRVQGFDPPGVAARDLKECLLIQLEILGADDEQAFF